MKKSKLLVIGSVNTDMVVKTHSLPKPGETVMGGTFVINAGGKGANQAVAAVRLGVDVTLMCKVGTDSFGEKSKKSFEEEGIDTSYMLFDSKLPSGVALITVDDSAENCIVVAPGANAGFLISDIACLPSIIEQYNYVLLQLEIPIETIEAITEIAFQKKVPVILNPAPAQDLSANLLSKLDLITPNESEAEQITSIKVIDDKSALLAAKSLHAMGVRRVVITLGSKGAFIYEDDKGQMVSSYPVNAIDTTAAGDVFNGALIVRLIEGKSLYDAADFACKASSISVTRLGAQSSAPYRAEIKKM